jgi:hypothetical protein
MGMALSSRELNKRAVDCGYERVSDRLEGEDGTWTPAVTPVSQWSTSFWRAVTSSTEHFFEATRATMTLDYKRRRLLYKTERKF